MAHGETVTHQSLKKTKIKMAWQLTLLYSKPLSYLNDRLEDLSKVINRIELETTMFQRFIDVNQLDVTIESSVSITDWASETTLAPPVDNTASMGYLRMPGKRTKKRDLSLEHKLSIAHHYLRSMVENYEVRKRQAHIYYNELVAATENQELKWKTIQNEINCLISKVGPTMCFPSKKPKDVQDREYLSSEKWWTIAVVPNDTNRDRLIRATKLDNVSLLQQIRNVEVICKYEEKVDVAEFLRKMLEKFSFPAELKQLGRKRGKMQCLTEFVERNAQNLRRLLEKEVAYGEELRGRIARERRMLDHVQQSLAMSAAASDKERATDKRLVQLLDDYQGPPVLDYILMNRQAMELKEIVKMWQHKVAAAKMVKDLNQQRWTSFKRISAKMEK